MSLTWAEIEADISDFNQRAETVRAAELQRNAVSAVQRETERRQHLEEIQRTQQAIIEETLEKINAREVMEAVRNDIFTEGEVRDLRFAAANTDARGHYSFGGLNLTSEKIDNFMVGLHTGRNFKLELWGELIKLDTIVRVDYPTDNSLPTLESASVYIKAHGINLIPGLAFPEGLTLEELIQKKGLVKAFHEIYVGSRTALVNNHSLRVNAADPEARAKFYVQLKCMIDTHFKEEGATMLPGIVRPWLDSIINQIPDLREQRVLTRAELFDWEAKIRGRFRLFTFIESLVN